MGGLFVDSTRDLICHITRVLTGCTTDALTDDSNGDCIVDCAWVPTGDISGDFLVDRTGDLVGHINGVLTSCITAVLIDDSKTDLIGDSTWVLIGFLIVDTVVDLACVSPLKGENIFFQPILIGCYVFLFFTVDDIDATGILDVTSIVVFITDITVTILG